MMHSVVWPRAKERIELFPVLRGKCSGLVTDQTSNITLHYFQELKHYQRYKETNQGITTVYTGIILPHVFSAHLHLQNI